MSHPLLCKVCLASSVSVSGLDLTEKERDIEVMGGSLPLLRPASNVHNMHSAGRKKRAFIVTQTLLSQSEVLLPKVYFHFVNYMLILVDLL